MKALTVRQPWAWAIAAGLKPIENRTWNTSYRGPLAIHAASRWDGDEALKRVYELTGIYMLETATSAVVAVAELVGTHNSVTCIRPIPDRHLHDDGPFTCSRWAVGIGEDIGMWHWELANVRELAYPVPCKGRLSLWDLPADVESSVLAQSSKAPGDSR